MQDLVDELDLVPEEAVALLRDVTILALRNERSKGIGPAFVKLGREVYYRKSGLKDLIQANTVTPIDVPTLTSGTRRNRPTKKKEARRERATA